MSRLSLKGYSVKFVVAQHDLLIYTLFGRQINAVWQEAKDAAMDSIGIGHQSTKERQPAYQPN
jgi:hypothetical protein